MLRVLLRIRLLLWPGRLAASTFRQILATVAVLGLTACGHGLATAARRAPEAETSTGRAGRSQTPELLDKLVGPWVLTGNIAGKSVVHDVEADWVLQHKYVRISEISRERGDDGQPQYEATIFVGWLESTQHFACLWLDNTEVASGDVTWLRSRLILFLSSSGIGRERS
jgi:hypothetical protein